jgi:hypothetical protein
MPEWRVYSDAEIEAARRSLKRTYGGADFTDYEAVWCLRDTHEPGWRDRPDRPADRLVECLTGRVSTPPCKPLP